MSRLHTALAIVTLTLGGCAGSQLPPETATRPAPPPWTDPVDSVELDAQCSSGTAPIACRKLAVRFFREGDEDAARRALTGGCAGAGSDACWRWGAAFVVSDRVREDARLARVMFEAGCEGGSMKACRGLYRTLLAPVPLFPDEPLREIRLSSVR